MLVLLIAEKYRIDNNNAYQKVVFLVIHILDIKQSLIDTIQKNQSTITDKKQLADFACD